MLEFVDFKFLIVLVFIDCLKARFLLIKLENEDEIPSRLRLRSEHDGRYNF